MCAILPNTGSRGYFGQQVVGNQQLEASCMRRVLVFTEAEAADACTNGTIISCSELMWDTLAAVHQSFGV